MEGEELGMTSSHFIKTPLGVLEAVYSGKGLLSLSLVDEGKKEEFSGLCNVEGNEWFAALKTNINDHFYGRNPGKMNIVLDMEGLSPFRRRVYEALMKVPFGEVVTYGELAARAGCPGGARAVGNAMNANPYLIIIPCHRVVASGSRKGKPGLGGFGAGLDAKRFLLRLEGHQDDIDDL
ncbi:MAG: methylated-DNA--[protein]-cysteine S-methyltransferase [Thermoplasmatota archaeon]